MGKIKAWLMLIEETMREVEGKDLSEVITHVQDKVFPKPSASTIKDIYKTKNGEDEEYSFFGEDGE